MKIYRYESVRFDAADGLNSLLRQGWLPIRETHIPSGSESNSESAAATLLILLEKEVDRLPFPGETLAGNVPITFLQDVMLFDGFELNDLQRVVGLCDVRTFDPETVLFQTGDEAHWLAVVLKGDVQVGLPELPVQQTTIAVLQPGGVFGESTFFSESPHTMSARTGANGATLLSLTRPSYDELAHIDANVAARLANNAARILAGRLQETDEWVWELLQQNQIAQVSASWRRFRHRVRGGDVAGGGFFGV
ncbi:MAG: cyclic nucleotide-binding domain-containing protein [Planctomycetaceae bacterium]